MSESKSLPQGVSRRRFLASTAAAAVTASLARRAKAQRVPASWVRVSLTDPAAPAMLDSYQTAIKALLKLDPNDGRNFYRNALIHTLDCPHGDWWFLPWHRAYLGWWERTVREFSKNPNFAFPYWDWTAQPFVPDVFWQGVLNPADPAFLSSGDAYYTALNPALTKFYQNATPAQQTRLTARGYPTAQSFFDFNKPSGIFLPPSPARSLTRQNPNFDSYTQSMVSLRTVNAALATPYFAGGDSNPPGGFGSDRRYPGVESAGMGILESGPHNNVHNDTGGFMRDLFSPIDPIFMAHHANIERIWTIWTAKQEAAGQPALPTGNELTLWQQEPFVFFFNEDGKPVTSVAGDYATVGSFGYTYTRGSGAPAAAREGADAPPPAAMASVRRVTGSLKSSDMALAKAAVAQVTLPAGIASRQGGAPTRVRAHVTIVPPAMPKGVRFHVFVNPPDNELALGADHPSYAGTFEIFGHTHHAVPITFTMSLDDALDAHRGAGTLKSDQIYIHIVPQTRGISMRALPKTTVTKVEITAF
jgi:tyrosinase